MTRSDTRRVVAVVADKHPSGNRPILPFPNPTMEQNIPMTRLLPYDAVPPSGSTCPYPTPQSRLTNAFLNFTQHGFSPLSKLHFNLLTIQRVSPTPNLCNTHLLFSCRLHFSSTITDASPRLVTIST